MQTRRLFHRRTLLGAAAFVLGCVAFFGAARAQNLQRATLPAGASVAATDHDDPDDLRTYADVAREDRVITLRGQQFTLHLYRPQIAGPALPAIYACGDGGWRGLAPRTAEQLAHLGFAVAGLDSKAYLRLMASPQQPLTIAQLANDYAAIARVARAHAGAGAQTPVYVYGWSLGAGFAVAVGSAPATRANWAGIIPIGLPAQNQLVSGLGGNSLDLTRSANARYGFRTETLMGALAPLPVVMIESAADTASPPKIGRQLFAAARDPKRYVEINADNHRFSGARSEFYAALGDARTWIEAARAAGGGPADVANNQAAGKEGRP